MTNVTKVGYRSSNSATAALEKIKKRYRRNHIYRCAAGSWHLTSWASTSRKARAA